MYQLVQALLQAGQTVGAQGLPRPAALPPGAEAQFSDDHALLHTVADYEWPAPTNGAKPAGIFDTAVCFPLPESVPHRLRALFPRLVNRLLPTYTTVARDAANGVQPPVTGPTPAGWLRAGSARFFAAHFSSFYAYAVVLSVFTATLDAALWGSVCVVFAATTMGTLLATAGTVVLVGLAAVAPSQYAPGGQSHGLAGSIAPPADMSILDYLHRLMALNLFGGRGGADIPAPVAEALRFVSGNGSAGMLVATVLLAVVGLLCLAAVSSLACAVMLALAPAALHRQQHSNGNNAASSVIAVTAHETARTVLAVGDRWRQAASGLARQSLVALLVLKMSLSMYTELEKSRAFPVLRPPTEPVSLSTDGTVRTTAEAINHLVSFLTTVALTFVTTGFLAGKLVGWLFASSRVPFYVAAEAPKSAWDDDALAAAKAELAKDDDIHPRHGAILPRCPDRLRARPDETAPSPAPLPSAIRQYYTSSATGLLPAVPAQFDAQRWLVTRALHVLSTDAVAALGAVHRLLTAALVLVSALIFWRWSPDRGLPLPSTNTVQEFIEAASRLVLGLAAGDASVLDGWADALQQAASSAAAAFLHTNDEPLAASPNTPLAAWYNPTGAPAVKLIFACALSGVLAVLTYAVRLTNPADGVWAKYGHAKHLGTGPEVTSAEIMERPGSLSYIHAYLRAWYTTQSAALLRRQGHEATSAAFTPAFASAYGAEEELAKAPPLLRAPLLPGAGLIAVGVPLLTIGVATEATRTFVLRPFVGLLAATVAPKLLPPMAGGPSAPFGLLGSNPIFLGALTVVALQLCYLVFRLLAHLRAGVVGAVCLCAFVGGAAAALHAVLAATRTPLFRPLRHAYVDGVFDLSHTGHKRLVEYGSLHADRVFCGVMCDEDCVTYKRRPIMTTGERCEEVARLAGAFRAIPASPPKGLSAAFLAHYGITHVVFGEEYNTPDDHYYRVPRDVLGLGVPAPRSAGISTSDIIKRIRASDPAALGKI